MTDGEVIIDAVIRASAIQDAEPIIGSDGEPALMFIWAANAPEQIEAALADHGYVLRRINELA